MMKDLSKFEAVKTALATIQLEADVDNGTHGMTFAASYWQHESAYDKDRAEKRTEMAKAIFAGQLEEVKRLQEEIKNLPPVKTNMVFRLETPIKRLLGTKKITDGSQVYKLSMDNVEYLLVPADAIELKLLSYVETNRMELDMMGRETPVIAVTVNRGLIDVAPPKISRSGREFLPKRAIVTALSYHAMQVAGELMSRESDQKRRRYGFDKI